MERINIDLLCNEIRKTIVTERIPDDILDMVKIYCYGTVRLMCEWITDSIPTSPERLAEIMERAGLSKLDYRGIDGVSLDENNPNRAIADVRFYQSEAANEFVFKVVLEKDDDSDWRITRLENFREFTELIAQTRRAALDKYLEQTSDLKVLLTGVVKKDWEVRKQELFGVEVPKAAEPLQNLRMRICDLSIESAADYAKWMEDKKSATVKSADEKHKQVLVLLDEEKLLIGRMTRR